MSQMKTQRKKDYLLSVHNWLVNINSELILWTEILYESDLAKLLDTRHMIGISSTNS